MPHNPNKPCVLVVDDVPENIDVLAGALSRDYNVKVALNGQDALDIAFAKPNPDVVLLDILMPGMDGYEVCRRLKENDDTRGIPVIFVTALDEMDDETRGFETGGVDYITKPIRIPIVLSRVKAHLELKMARESLKAQNRLLEENLRLRDDVDSIIRHDIKTPINVILWGPDIVESEGNLNPNQIDTLRIMKQASYSMLKIMNSSINLIKMERGEYQLQVAPVNVLKSLFQIKNEMRGLMRTKHVDLDIKIGNREPVPFEVFIINGEEILFYTVLTNLIKNAIEASPDNEKVTVSLQDRDLFLILIHNKEAVPEHIRERFFDKYVTAKKISGTGLGTYSARMITETMNGSIHMETSREKGTMLTLKFPK